MAEEMNGAVAVGDAPAQDTNPPVRADGTIEATAENVDQVMAEYMHTPLNTVVRGIWATIQGVPPHKILLALCRTFGAIIGSGCSKGVLQEVFNRRRQYMDAFEEGVRSAVPEPLTEMPKPQTGQQPRGHANRFKLPFPLKS